MLCVAALLIAGLLAEPASKAQSAGTPSASPAPHAALQAPTLQGKKAEEQFKNIQVLKGVPAEEIFPTMEFIRASLGVECSYCHVQNEFDRDDKKPKKIARKMMEMMFAINADDFDGERKVTCNSCHHGNLKPLAIPTVMTESVTPATASKPEASVPAGLTAIQLIDKYVQALGGAAAIDKVTSRVMKGTIDFGGMSLPIAIYAKDPEMRISFTRMPEGDSVTAFNGHEGWLSMTGRPLREMHGSDLDGAAIDADLHLATHFKQMFTSTEIRGTEKVGDHETYVVVGQRNARPPIELYFDEQSGLLVRLVRFGDTALGLLPTQIDYADYREVRGVKTPYQWTLARPSGRFTIQLSDVQQNVPVDDARFVKPAPQPSQPPSGPAK